MVQIVLSALVFLYLSLFLIMGHRSARSERFLLFPTAIIGAVLGAFFWMIIIYQGTSEPPPFAGAIFMSALVGCIAGGLAINMALIWNGLCSALIKVGK